MNTTKNLKVTAAVLALVATLTLTGCSNSDTDAPATSTKSTSTETAIAEPPVETPAPVTKDSPAGTAVPAGQVDAIRAEGGHVYKTVTTVGGDYMTPGSVSGDGVIVTPGAGLPGAVIADVRSAVGHGGDAGASSLATVGMEFRTSGAAGFFLYEAGAFPGLPDVRYVVRMAGDVPGAAEFWAGLDGGGSVSGFASKDDAIAEMQPMLDANPTLTFTDLTL